jgi:NAD-dependent histone deacetylase SIR2
VSLSKQTLHLYISKYSSGDPELCTLDEAKKYRQLLRTIGPEEFCRRTVEADVITAKKLLTAFGIRPPAFLDGQPDEDYYELLSMIIHKELTKRCKLPQYNTVDDVVTLIQGANNIIVLTGAGISTSLGIPDFRSKDTGLYTKIGHLGLSDPQEVFNIELFREDPTIFYSIAKDLIVDLGKFSPTHAFIHLLQEKGKLLTNYSQNIDNIEAKAGILPEKLIQCHGSFATASCVKCHFQVPGDAIEEDIKAGRIPTCKRCIQTLRASQDPAAMKRKRSKNGTEKKRAKRFDGSDDSSSDEDYTIAAAGVMKPDITFFGEDLPDTFSDRLTKHDRDKVDLVIVIGTSLKVAPVSEVIPYLPAHIPQVYISRTPISHINFDIDILGDCDVVVAELCRRAGWDLKHEMIPEKQVVDVELQEGFLNRHVFTERTS